MKGQGHLLAMSERPKLSIDLTESSCAAAIARWSGAPPGNAGRGFRKPDIRR